MLSLNVEKVLKNTTLRFKRKGIASPGLDAEILLFSYLKTDRPGLYMNFERLITDEELKGFSRWVERREVGEPVAYIVGRKEFWSLTFEVNPRVLVPRPETEFLVEEVLGLCSDINGHNMNVLEIGTGSGAISVSIASELEKVHIVATDIAEDAITLARKNAGDNGVASRIDFLCGNLFEPVSGKFDVIIANPPYISDGEFAQLSPEVRDFEPREALLAGPLGTEFYHDLIVEGGRYLKHGGWLLMEMGAGQKDAIESMLGKNTTYDSIGFRTDYAGIERTVRARRK